jgi:uncharacterized protein
MSHQIALIAAIALIVPGVFMALVPMLPALSYMFVVSLFYAIFDRFTTLSGKETIVLMIVALVSIAVDHISGILGAKYGGAHTKSLLWGILGALIGTFIFPPPFGSLVGLFLAVLIAELRYKKNHQGALKAAGGAVMGSIAGIAVNICLAIAFVCLFLFFVLR